MPSHTITMRTLCQAAYAKMEHAAERYRYIMDRFDEQGGDGDVPTAQRDAYHTARAEYDALLAACELMPDDRTPEEIQADEDAHEEAVMRRHDRDTYRAECGYAE